MLEILSDSHGKHYCLHEIKKIMFTKSTFAVTKFKNMVNNINFDYFVKNNIYSELCLAYIKLILFTGNLNIK